MACPAINLWFEPVLLICRLWRHVGFALPSGKGKRTTKIMAILFILSNTLRRTDWNFFHVSLEEKR
jgi:hypothetical protein